MNKLIRILTAGLAALLTAATAAGTGASARAGIQEESGQTERILLVASDDDAEETLDGIARGIAGLDSGAGLLYTYRNAWCGLAVRTDAPLDGIAALPHVTSVHESAQTEAEPCTAAAGQTVASGALQADTGLRGQGTVAAVIDAGFDTGHPIFTLTDEESARLQRADVRKYVSGGLKASDILKKTREDPFCSLKIPFAFDYCGRDCGVYNSGVSHGTAVASVLAGNKAGDEENGFDGIAPEAQLILMKVARDGSRIVEEYAVLAALDDAIALDADVINLSFGSTAGFASFTDEGADYTGALTRAYNHGIDVFCAAGNEGRVGEGSLWDIEYGISDPPAYIPDYGMVAEPSSLNRAVSVASLNNSVLPVTTYLSADGKTLLYMDAQNSNLAKTLGEGTYTYVPVGGVGRESDYKGLNVSGKLALVERGTLRFIEKIRAARDAGAAAILIYDNTEDAERIRMACEEVLIPAVFLTREDGLYLLKRQDRTVKLVTTTLETVPYAEAGRLSDFSSWGATPSLTLKPDLIAPGGNLQTAVNDGEYSTQSGTSFSSPVAAGCALLFRQKTGNSLLQYGSSYTRRMLMSTAVPVTDKASGVEYSPRAQGAGLISLDAALAGTAYITGQSGECRLELGDRLAEGDGRFETTFTVRNFGEEALEWRLNVSVLTDATYYDEKAGQSFFDGSSAAMDGVRVTLDGGKSINLNRSAMGAGYEKIRVEGLSTVTFTLAFTLDRDELSALHKVCGNGFYIEGFVYLTAVSEGAQDLSVPYLGFSDDWGALPVFDEAYGANYAFTYVMTGSEIYMMKLGENAFGEQEGSYVTALSPDSNGYGDTLGFAFSSLRNIRACRYEIYSEDGLEFASGNGGAYRKAVIQKETLSQQPLNNLWNGRDTENPQCILPDGKYTLVLYAQPDWSGAEEQVLKLDFLLDTVDPQIRNIALTQRGSRWYLTFDVSDNRGVQFVWVYESAAMEEAEKKEETEGSEETEKLLSERRVLDGGKQHTVEVDVTEHLVDTDIIYIDVIDCAYNWKTFRFDRKG